MIRGGHSSAVEPKELRRPAHDKTDIGAIRTRHCAELAIRKRDRGQHPNDLKTSRLGGATTLQQ